MQFAPNVVHHKPLQHLIVPFMHARRQSCGQKLQGKSIGLVVAHAARSDMQDGASSLGVDDWMSAAFPESEKDIDDEALNEVCNIALKAMLQEDGQVIESIQEDLLAMGSFFTTRDNRDGALFILALYKLTDHEISLAVDSLQGKYKDAFLKVFGLLEDSGWKLKQEGEEDDEDEDALPAMGSGMYG